MTEAEAEQAIAEYRKLLKAWTMSITGIEQGNVDALRRRLDESQHQLSEIAIAFPNKAYSVDLLVNARTRTWAGYEEERVPRPVGAR